MREILAAVRMHLFFHTHQGITAMKRLILISAVTLMAAAPAARADQALATSKACMACHATDKKLVGPAYKEVAAKYAGKKDGVATMVGKIMKGSSGDWGPVPMPANANVSNDEATKLAKWILTLK